VMFARGKYASGSSTAGVMATGVKYACVYRS
jgi:hypothetical protein